MKIVFAIVLLAAAAYAAPVDEAMDFPTKCEDVLADPLCVKLHDIANRIGVKFAEVEAKIKEAVANGKSKAWEIMEAVEDYYKKHIALKTCEDFLGDAKCAQIKSLFKMLGATAEKVDKVVKEAILKGAAKAKEIYQQVIAYLRNKLAGKRSIEMTLIDHDLELLDELELDDEAFEKRNVIIDVLKKKLEFLGKIFGKVLNSNLDKILNEIVTTRKAEIEAIIGQGPYAILKLALEIYQRAKAMG